MFGNILFGLTFIAYIALTIFNLQRMNATGDGLVSWGIIAFVILAVYVICSLILTISITAKGGFNWLSNSAFLRNIAVGIIWLGMVAGVVFCAMLRFEWHTNQSTGWIRWFTIPVYFGSTWLPVLMLVPYAILLNPEWRNTVSANLYKLPLVIGCITGFLILIAPNIVMTISKSIPQKEIDISEAYFKNDMNTINGETSIKELLKFSLNEDQRVRMAAWTKIKTYNNWEGELVKILEQIGPYGHYDFYWVYLFLDSNKIEHPERFIKPINNTIPAITSEIQVIFKKSFRETSSLRFLTIDIVCRVLDKQFKDSSTVFRPNILKLQEALDAPPLERSDDIQEFIEMRNTYRHAVKNYLDTH